MAEELKRFRFYRAIPMCGVPERTTMHRVSTVL
jgi:hypothetical protein